MKKFTGVLLASDYDNTLLITKASEHAPRIPNIPERNRKAIQYFMENGGTFAISTGRAVAAMEKFISHVPMNAPAIVCNGAALYDFHQEKYLELITLDGEIPEQCQDILEKFPTVAIEAYPLENIIHAVRPNAYTRRHENITFVSVKEDASLLDIPQPLTKLMFEDSHEVLEEIQEYILEQPWSSACEICFTDVTLLEVMRKGATKGNMVHCLAKRLKISPEHIYCVGDEENDISMITMAARGFAPDNCVASVRESGATIVSHAGDGAVADIINILDQLYT